MDHLGENNGHVKFTDVYHIDEIKQNFKDSILLSCIVQCLAVDACPAGYLNQNVAIN